MMSRAWWHAASVRAVRTMGQTLTAGLSVYVAARTSNLITIDWLGLVSLTVLSGLLSFATSLGGLPEINSSDSHKSDI